MGPKYAQEPWDGSESIEMGHSFLANLATYTTFAM